MTEAANEALLFTFLVFCRIGGCLMVMPGIASPRIPMQVRLFLSLAVVLALVPLLYSGQSSELSRLTATGLVRLIAFELATGFLIGLIGRIFFLILQFFAIGVANFVGVGTMPAPPIEENEPAPTVATFITLLAVMMMLANGLHYDFIRAALDSYTLLPITHAIDTEYTLTQIKETLTLSTAIALQISSPFFIYAILINFVFGLVNRLTPQIPVYFVSLPFIVCGGLFVLYYSVGEMLRIFILILVQWLRNG